MHAEDLSFLILRYNFSSFGVSLVVVVVVVVVLLVVRNVQDVVFLIISPVYDFSYLSEDGYISWTINHCQLIAWTLDVDDSVWPSGYLS